MYIYIYIYISCFYIERGNTFSFILPSYFSFHIISLSYYTNSTYDTSTRLGNDVLNTKCSIFFSRVFQ